MPVSLFHLGGRSPRRLYLDESGTLGFGGELFTMAMVLVDDLQALETSIARHRITQTELKASQMKTSQKLALAHKILAENSLGIYLARLDPLAAQVSERKLDKELLYDSMVAQALSYYLERGDLARNELYRLSMDMRGGMRESDEDLVGESVGNVLMHRPNPLVEGIEVRFLDSKYSAGVQAADLFSNIYRTALTSRDTACQGFLRKYMDEGMVYAGFTFGLRQLADQMTQIAADLRARVEQEELAGAMFDDVLLDSVETESGASHVADELFAGGAGDESKGGSRSARRRRSRASRKEREASVPSTRRYVAGQAAIQAESERGAEREAPESPAGVEVAETPEGPRGEGVSPASDAAAEAPVVARAVEAQVEAEHANEEAEVATASAVDSENAPTATDKPAPKRINRRTHTRKETTRGAKQSSRKELASSAEKNEAAPAVAAIAPESTQASTEVEAAQSALAEVTESAKAIKAAKTPEPEVAAVPDASISETAHASEATPTKKSRTTRTTRKTTRKAEGKAPKSESLQAAPTSAEANAPAEATDVASAPADATPQDAGSHEPPAPADNEAAPASTTKKPRMRSTTGRKPTTTKRTKSK